MANMYFTPEGLKSVGYVRLLQVGTADPVTKIEQQFCDTAHTDSTDPDKMYMLAFPVHIS
jgi:hypothetical protein